MSTSVLRTRIRASCILAVGVGVKCVYGGWTVRWVEGKGGEPGS